MSLWYCRECKRDHPEETMLPGWNGLWCPNCIWNEVIHAGAHGGAVVDKLGNEVIRTPEPGLRAGMAQAGCTREHHTASSG